MTIGLPRMTPNDLEEDLAALHESTSVILTVKVMHALATKIIERLATEIRASWADISDMMERHDIHRSRQHAIRMQTREEYDANITVLRTENENLREELNAVRIAGIGASVISSGAEEKIESLQEEIESLKRMLNHDFH